MKRTNKKSLKTIAFLSAFIFIHSSIAAETNEVNKAAVASNPVTNRFSWLADFDVSEGITNSDGLSCNLKNNQGTPYCTAYIDNKSTNKFLRCWVFYQASYLRVNLQDSEGRDVEKTAAGKLCGNLPSQQQLKEMAVERRREYSLGKYRTDGFRPVLPKADYQLMATFDIRDLFNIKQSGEYRLQVQMPVLQNTNIFDANSEFKITWLPKVVAKVQIRPEDIAQTNSVSNGQTNSPSQ